MKKLIVLAVVFTIGLAAAQCLGQSVSDSGYYQTEQFKDDLRELYTMRHLYKGDVLIVNNGLSPAAEYWRLRSVNHKFDHQEEMLRVGRLIVQGKAAVKAKWVIKRAKFESFRAKEKAMKLRKEMDQRMSDLEAKIGVDIVGTRTNPK